MVVSIFGLGFVGLTTAVGFAEKGIEVYGIDIDKERTEIIRNLNKTFFLPEDVESAIRKSDCIFYCVGTPYGEGGQADLTYLYSAIEETLKFIDNDKFRVLVTKSTIPPSTTKDKIIPFVESKGVKVGKCIGIANNPEFLREGHCWDDFMNADRIIVGVEDIHSEKILRNLYSRFAIPFFAVSMNTGEFIKYLSNTILATLISYSNEMSIVADIVGDIDISDAFNILHMDKRWGGCSMTSYLYPGCGYGGYCLPKDTNAIYSLVKSMGYDAGILGNVIAVNEKMPTFITRRITKSLSKKSKIGILGLSFKPNSDDVRDTPAAKVIKQLLQEGYMNILVYDPIAMDEFKKNYKLEVTYSQIDTILKEADILVILTAWDEFRKLSELTDKKIIDCRYML